MIHFPIESLLNLAKSVDEQPDPFHNSLVGDARTERQSRKWLLAIQIVVGGVFVAFAIFVLWAVGQSLLPFLWD